MINLQGYKAETFADLKEFKILGTRTRQFIMKHKYHKIHAYIFSQESNNSIVHFAKIQKQN